jgi:hypothetical protein
MRRLVTALLALLPLATFAANAVDPIAHCRSAHGDEPAAHIACLEDALRARDAQRSAAVQTTGTAAATPAAATPVPSGSAAQAATATPAVTAVEAAPAGLGAEQAAARRRAKAPEGAEEAARVRIVEFRYTLAGIGVFRMADGQVWQETVASPARVHLKPGKEYEATIERGTLGGYRMYVEGVRWMHKVERLL